MTGPSRYKRAFNWKLSTTQAETRRGVAATFRTLSNSEVTEVLEDYLELTRKRRNNRWALTRLQFNLLNELRDNEAAGKFHRQEEDRCQKALDVAPTHAEHEQVDQDLGDVRNRKIYGDLLGNCLRAIADGIAWRAFGYDRAALRALSERQTRQQVLVEGMPQEIEDWWRRSASGDSIVILNALTNWLAHGDVTVVCDDGSAEIIEVKSGGVENSRLRRQKEAMRGVVELLSRGVGEADGGRRTEIFVSDAYPDNGLKSLLELLEEAKREGFAWRRLSNFLYFDCLAPWQLENVQQAATLLDEKLSQGTADWRASDDVVVPRQSLDYLGFSPNVAPYSVFPFPSRVCVEILLGQLLIRSVLNVSAVAREFERRGWRVTKSPKEYLAANKTFDTGFIAVAKAGREIEVGPAWMDRMQLETLRPQVVIKTLDQMLTVGLESKVFHPFIVLKDEAAMWD